MRQVERHWIKENHELYSICDDLTFKAKNLYNAGLYQIRQSIFERDKCKEDVKPSVRSWVELVSQFRKDKQVDMLALPSKVSTNILKLVGSSISSYYQLLKCFHDKSNLSVTNKPKPPRYLHKTEGRYIVEFTNQTISKKRGDKGELIICPKDLNLHIPTKVENPKCVRIVPKLGAFVIEVIYEVEEAPLKHTGNYAAIDLGVDNLVSVTFSNGVNPLLVKGSKIKSINQGYNRLIAKVKSNLPTNQKTSKHIHRLWRNREMKLQAELHKITSFLSLYFDEMSIEKVFIGKNVGWKQEVALGKKTNQTFVNIPYTAFISQLTYKCKLRGIEVVEQEESYTSKASFVDHDEIPVYGEVEEKPQFSGKRISRGLYKTKQGFLLNADVNGSYNILVKGLATLGKVVDRALVSYHTRSLRICSNVSNLDLISNYM
jgi:transposase, IS605 orfB family